MALYDLNDSVRLGNPTTAPEAAAFATILGTPTDPTAVTLTILRPDRTILVYGWPSAGADGTLVRESAGRFYTELVLNQAGVWRYRIEGTGAVVAAAAGTLTVARSTVI